MQVISPYSRPNPPAIARIEAPDVPPVEPVDSCAASSWGTVVGRIALGALALGGAVATAPATTSLAGPPTTSRSTSQTSPQHGPVQPGARIHVISHIDATEPVISPFATQNMQELEQLRLVGGDNVAVDAVLVRDPQTGAKAIVGGIYLAITFAPLAGSIWLARRNKTSIPGLLLVSAGVVGSAAMGIVGGTGLPALKYSISALADVTAEEPRWSGTRTYEVLPDRTGAIDSRVLSHEDVRHPRAGHAGEYIGQRMNAYPRATTVVHLVGHGLGYRSSSGFEFSEYQRLLQQAHRQSGRPVDLLLVESCLEGNLEAMLGSYPHVRYAIVSEESIAAGELPAIFTRTIQRTGGSLTDPLELGRAVIEEARQSGVETLALIDMQQLPALKDSVNTLGDLLLREVQAGRTAPLVRAVTQTQTYPAGGVHGDMGQKLGMGDLRSFARNIEAAYDGPIRQAARQVLQRLDRAVPALHTSPEYRGAGGLSIQMPVPHLQRLETRLENQASFDDSAAPQQWKAFVHALGPYLQERP